jgi:hypothetical protein
VKEMGNTGVYDPEIIESYVKEHVKFIKLD